jgi:hypothetical protein
MLATILFSLLFRTSWSVYADMQIEAVWEQGAEETKSEEVAAGGRRLHYEELC